MRLLFLGGSKGTDRMPQVALSCISARRYEGNLTWRLALSVSSSGRSKSASTTTASSPSPKPSWLETCFVLSKLGMVSEVGIATLEPSSCSNVIQKPRSEALTECSENLESSRRHSLDSKLCWKPTHWNSVVSLQNLAHWKYKKIKWIHGNLWELIVTDSWDVFSMMTSSSIDREETNLLLTLNFSFSVNILKHWLHMRLKDYHKRLYLKGETSIKSYHIYRNWFRLGPRCSRLFHRRRRKPVDICVKTTK